MQRFDALFIRRKEEIRGTQDLTEVPGARYYVSADGNDAADGRTPDTAWASLARVCRADLQPGDGVFFQRGAAFRGSVTARPGVTYGAFGSGQKPRLYGAELSLADPALWRLWDAQHHIWQCTRPLLDVGTLVFDGGGRHGRKLIPSYKNGGFVCRQNEAEPFDMTREMTQDLDLYWHFDAELSTRSSAGQSFPVPDVIKGGRGQLFLRCDGGNPGAVFGAIEPLSAVHMFDVGGSADVTIDNLCIAYVGRHGVAGGHNCAGLRVTNCEFGWIGGAIQHYDGTDPNYPQGGRGMVTRYGNAVEIYGSCSDYVVCNNYITQVYDAGITHQMTAAEKIIMENVTYADNLIENCVYGIEYFLQQLPGGEESCMRHICIKNNFIRLTGYGWGQQRPNADTPAAVKGWSFTNPARDFVIADNIFDRSAYRLLHLVAQKAAWCPRMQGNTYIQYADGLLGQYGANEQQEPQILPFDEAAAQSIKTILRDDSAAVIRIEE